MKVIKSRFEILPFDILEKIFNLKFFETDDIDTLINKYYFKNEIHPIIEEEIYMFRHKEIIRECITSYGIQSIDITPLKLFKDFEPFENSEFYIAKDMIMSIKLTTFNSYKLQNEPFYIKFFTDYLNGNVSYRRVEDFIQDYNKYNLRYLDFNDYTKKELITHLKYNLGLRIKNIHKLKKDKIIKILKQYRRDFKKPSIEDYKRF